MILALQILIFFHHSAQLLFQLLEPSYPRLINDRAIYVNRHFHLKRHFHFHFLLNFHVPVDVDGLIYVNRLIDDDWVLVDGLINVDGFFYDLLHLYLLDYDFRDLLLDLDVLGHFYDLLYDSLRAGDVSWNLHFHFHWPLDN